MNPSKKPRLTTPHLNVLDRSKLAADNALCKPVDTWDETDAVSVLKIFPNFWDRVPRFLKTRKVICTFLENGINLSLMSDEDKTEYGCLTAVVNYSGALEWVPGVLQTYAMCIVAVSRSPDVFKYVVKKHRTSELVKILLAANYHTLYDLTYDEKLKHIREVENAVVSMPGAIECVEESLWTKPMVIAAIINKPDMLETLAVKYRTNDILTAVIAASRTAVIHLTPDEFMKYCPGMNIMRKAVCSPPPKVEETKKRKLAGIFSPRARKQ